MGHVFTSKTLNSCIGFLTDSLGPVWSLHSSYILGGSVDNWSYNAFLNFG